MGEKYGDENERKSCSKGDHEGAGRTEERKEREGVGSFHFRSVESGTNESLKDVG